MLRIDYGGARIEAKRGYYNNPDRQCWWSMLMAGGKKLLNPGYIVKEEQYFFVSYVFYAKGEKLYR